MDYFIRERSLQMEGNYIDSACKIPYGIFHYYHPNGKVATTGSYVNGKKSGLWASYYTNGMKKDSAVFENGHVVGTRLGWYQNGRLADSAILNQDGSGAEKRWFENGNLSEEGSYSAGHKRNGQWKFYHENGNISSIERYDANSLLSNQYFNEEGKLVAAPNANVEIEASFPGGDGAWRNFLQYTLNPNAPIYYRAPVGTYTVVLQFIVNTDGTISDIQPLTRHGYGMEQEAVRVIKMSPKWLPAIQHGRKVKAYRKQPITFAISQE
jgi:hypothetical protein